ncbi:Deoxyhypusine synthase [Ascosphaera pollenicola]|nr:Deoxyhypusine synthase [Ascosphaera pollenicola]
MGVGRRMKKQGMPEPLDESKITSLKRSKPGDATTTTNASKNKKRRTEPEPEPEAKLVVKSARAAKKQKKTQKQEEEKAKAEAGKKQSKKPVKKIEIESESEADEDEDLSMDDELPADEFDDWEDISEEGSGEEDDEGSEESSDDSAFDSEEEHAPRQHMFSDDEDESDAEEKLTAANIEGLSRKLDLQAAEEEEQARLEMEEAAMQTNIAGDALDVFDGNEKTMGLAPDLKLLRTRINETIRILDDLKTLGQPGKSRADYMKLLLDDICAYYGYTPYLAEKLMNLFTPREAFAFFEANETPRPVVIRTNTLRTNRRTQGPETDIFDDFKWD